MNKCRLGRLYCFDLKKGLVENRIKLCVAIFILLFFANVTIKSCIAQKDSIGFLGYWMMIIGGMPEYIKSKTSIFQLPVSWFLYYAYLFFLVGFYPTSDLYSCGSKTLLMSGNRKKWIISKYLWIMTVIIVYYSLFAICIFLNECCLVNTNIEIQNVMDIYMLLGYVDVIAVWFVIPILTSIAIAFLQFTITIISNAIVGYTISIIILVASTYWMKAFLPGNYLMIVRSNQIVDSGMKLIDGFALGVCVVVVSLLVGCHVFNKKDICKIVEK